jgi:hypothetical protein
MSVHAFSLGDGWDSVLEFAGFVGGPSFSEKIE